MDSRQIVRKAVAALSKEAVPADDSESLFETGVIDSFGLLDLVQNLEGAFGVKVPDADLNPRKFDNINKIVDYFDARSNNKKKQAGG
jgi:acyl carrier protein